MTYTPCPLPVSKRGKKSVVNERRDEYIRKVSLEREYVPMSIEKKDTDMGYEYARGEPW